MPCGCAHGFHDVGGDADCTTEADANGDGLVVEADECHP